MKSSNVIGGCRIEVALAMIETLQQLVLLVEEATAVAECVSISDCVDGLVRLWRPLRRSCNRPVNSVGNALGNWQVH